MESLDITKSKSLQFGVSINGIEHTKLTGQFQLSYNDIAISFPVEISESKMTVDLPSIQSLLKENIPVGSKIDCDLLIFGDGHYWNPWSESYKVASSVRVESVEETSKLDNTVSESEVLFNENKVSSVSVESVKETRNGKSLLDEDKELFEQFNIPDASSKASEGFENQDSKTKPVDIPEDKKELDFETYRKVDIPILDNIPTKVLSNVEKKKIMAQEIEAIKKGTPLSETNKNDNIKELKFRTRVREKLMEAVNVKEKHKPKTKLKSKSETIKESIESRKTQMLLSDHDHSLSGDVTEEDVRELMVSYGMSKSSSQKRMIENASGYGGGKLEWAAVYSTINNMLKPNGDAASSMEEQMKLMAGKK